ncbi:MAG: 5-oxoprolinase subunit PxpB [Gammaproteobacteria bacterium]|nr:5-oxoprolinase subunit PxpB [Gammaproteobacteria bacterium]
MSCRATELRFVLSRSADDKFSVSVGTTAEAQALAEQLRISGAWIDVVAGINSVGVQFDPLRIDATTARERIQAVIAEGVVTEPLAGACVEVPVIYGGDAGPDLDDVARRTSMSPEELVALHTGREYVVEMVGFTPGFAFVGGLDSRLRIPRRSEPRQRVPAGSVAIADGRTGLYAVASPGGWNLVGRTPITLFDPTADEPFLLRAGMRVRFKAIDA